MANAPLRPPWFGSRGVQALAVAALAYNVVQIVRQFGDRDWSAAFLSFAWCVLFSYVLAESLRARKEQEAAREDETEPGERPDDAPPA